MWLCIPFPVRHQFINLIKVVILSTKSIHIIPNKTYIFRYNKFVYIFFNEENDVPIFILSHAII